MKRLFSLSRILLLLIGLVMLTAPLRAQDAERLKAVIASETREPKNVARDIYRRIRKGQKSTLTDKLKGDPPAVRSKALARAYADGDKLACQVLDRVAQVLGIAIGSIVNLLSPELIVLGGGVIEALGPGYVQKIEKRAAKWAFEVNMRNVHIAPALLGDDSIIQGAAAYARQKLAEQPGE